MKADDDLREVSNRHAAWPDAELPRRFLRALTHIAVERSGAACNHAAVLDFIGHANRRFRVDARYRAILGGTRKAIESQVEAGFPSLPSGCVIQLDEIAQSVMLDTIHASLGSGKQGLIEDLRELAAAHSRR